MGRAPCCDKANVKKGPWSPEEDAKLKAYIDQYGTGGNWIALPQKIGLKRCGKSCRLRWLNYLRPNLKHGGFSEEEDNIICSLYVSIGSRWSIIAAQLPGRTDNDIKNYWNTRLKKKLLGKQRKEQQAQARRVTNQKQDVKRETENLKVPSASSSSSFAVINQTPYWPLDQYYSSVHMPLAVNASIQDFDLNNQTSLTSLLVHQQHQPPFTNTCDNVPSTQHHLYSTTMNMLNDHMPVASNVASHSTGSTGTNYHPSNMFETFPNDHLGEMVCVNPQQIMEGFNYGMEYSMDMSNGGSTNTASTESTSWGDMSSLVYSPNLVSEYEGHRQGIPQDVALEECRYFGMQMQ